MDLRTVTKGGIWLICLQSVNKKTAFKIFPLFGLVCRKELPLGDNGFDCYIKSELMLKLTILLVTVKNHFLQVYVCEKNYIQLQLIL